MPLYGRRNIGSYRRPYVQYIWLDWRSADIDSTYTVSAVAGLADTPVYIAPPAAALCPALYYTKKREVRSIYLFSRKTIPGIEPSVIPSPVRGWLGPPYDGR